jgi:5-methyltetrahydropteroyltriglutamate--homocysteine methyltransferase
MPWEDGTETMTRKPGDLPRYITSTGGVSRRVAFAQWHSCGHTQAPHRMPCPNHWGIKMTIRTANLGFPRIGRHRELKLALESYWTGKTDEEALLTAARKLRAANWLLQKDKGIAVIPSNDFSLYDHVLDTAVMCGAIPAAYNWKGGPIDLDTYFAMARGATDGTADEVCCHGNGCCHDVPALEMTKWFDTNYHFMVPELRDDQEFQLASMKPLDHFLEAKALGIQTRPVILGPVTFLKLSKSPDAGFDPLVLLPKLLPIYEDLLVRLHDAGADWVQIDEPALLLDLVPNEKAAFGFAYQRLAAASKLNLMLATYFGSLASNLQTAFDLPVAGIHVDLVRAPEQLRPAIEAASEDKIVSLGVIDGRNVWRADLGAILDRLEPALERLGQDRIQIAPSCSLLHVPTDLDRETDLEPDLKSWLAFADQKLDELANLGHGLNEGRAFIADALSSASAAVASRAHSQRVHVAAVQSRAANIDESMKRRSNPFFIRIQEQEQALHLPLFPTTTIGSFPQTSEVREARSSHAKGMLSDGNYEEFLQAETAAAIEWQEEIGLDVLVHGEFERNDMVQYFGEQLAGFAFTKHAWVQSYGSRCVRPPIIFGDVSRPKPMTVGWWQYAQSLTSKPVKGMLTGPVTILNWSFVRDDLPRSSVCRQIALAVRDEVGDLEAAGAKIIQIDEAALREGLPLKKSEWGSYLVWAVECFRLCSSGVSDHTQIHTHMCYSEFNQIITAIAGMDADVISIETSRSRMELLEAFGDFKYPNEIGLGIYDIHSPCVPSAAEMKELLIKARDRLADSQIWVNPDCGLKTRKWEEVRPSLINMVEAARELR